MAPHDLIADALKAQELEHKLQMLQAQVLALETQMQAMKKERESLMLWGLMTLGFAVVGLGGYIWNMTLGRK